MMLIVGFVIADIDECMTGENDCSENAECTDTFGGFVCTCFNGYQGDGKTCQS